MMAVSRGSSTPDERCWSGRGDRPGGGRGRLSLPGKAVRRGQAAGVGSHVAKAMRYVIVLSLFAAAGLVALSIPIIRVLYERGEWTAADTVGSAGALSSSG